MSDCIKIPLIGGREAVIDADDYGLVMKFSDTWRLLLHPNTYYARATYYRDTILMHRVIMNADDVTNQGLEVHHLDGNGLNNVRSNLRLVTHAENMRLRKGHKNNTSGHKGVNRSRQKWKADISVNSRKIHLGVFNTFEEAVAARIKAEKEFGYS